MYVYRIDPHPERAEILLNREFNFTDEFVLKHCDFLPLVRCPRLNFPPGSFSQRKGWESGGKKSTRARHTTQYSTGSLASSKACNALKVSVKNSLPLVSNGPRAQLLLKRSVVQRRRNPPQYKCRYIAHNIEIEYFSMSLLFLLVLTSSDFWRYVVF